MAALSAKSRRPRGRNVGVVVTVLVGEGVLVSPDAAVAVLVGEGASVSVDVAAGTAVLVGRGVLVSTGAADHCAAFVGRGPLIDVGVTVGIGVRPHAARIKPADDVPHNLKNVRRVNGFIAYPPI